MCASHFRSRVSHEDLPSLARCRSASVNAPLGAVAAVAHLSISMALRACVCPSAFMHRILMTFPLFLFSISVYSNSFHGFRLPLRLPSDQYCFGLSAPPVRHYWHRFIAHFSLRLHSHFLFARFRFEREKENHLYHSVVAFRLLYAVSQPFIFPGRAFRFNFICMPTAVTAFLSRLSVSDYLQH